MILLLAAVALAGTPVGAAVSLGDCPAAARAPRSGPADGLAVAWCFLEHDDPAAAWAALGEPTPGLEPYRAVLLAGAALGLGRTDAALAELDVASGHAGLQPAVASLRAQALVAKGDLRAASAAIDALLEGERGEPGHRPELGEVDPARVVAILARALEAAGDTAGARARWTWIWTHQPTTPEAQEAALALTRLGVDVDGRADPQWNEAVARRARTLRSLKMAPEALALYDTLPAALRPTVEARTAFDAKDYARAVRLWEQSPPTKAQDAFDRALAMSRTGDYAKAAGLYEDVIARFPGTKQADFASFKIAYLAYDALDFGRARDLFRAHLGRFPSSEHAEDARWWIAWSLARELHWPEARREFDALVERYPNSGTALRARYWSARAQGFEGDKASEERLLRELVERAPLSASAWFASQALGLQADGAAARVEPSPPEGPLRTAWDLAQSGLETWARLELVRAGGSGDPSLLLALGDHGGAQKRARSQGLCKKTAGNSSAPLCWPRPHADLVEPVMLSAGLPRYLPVAIMTNESALQPWVTSPAGARGLMQLMPAVGERVHSEVFPTRAYDANDLYQSAYNAWLGSHELARLHRSFDGRLELSALPAVIAGYNAGPEAVERWLSELDAASGPKDAAWFAENIGYTETRRYVRGVIETLQTYRVVYGD